MGRGLEGKRGSHSPAPMREAGDARARPRAGGRSQQPRPATKGPAGKLWRERGWLAGLLLDAARWGAGGVATTWWRGGASAGPRRSCTRGQVGGSEARYPGVRPRSSHLSEVGLGLGTRGPQFPHQEPF